MATSRWKTYFLLLALGGSVAAVLPVLFSRQRQLSQEDLRQARSLWGSRGPSDYTLLVRWKKTELPAENGRPTPKVARLKLRFREGLLVEATRDGDFVPVEQVSDWTSERVFGKLQSYLDRAKPKDFLVVDFSATDGHPRHWIWVSRQAPDRFREEVDLVLTPSP